MSTQKIIACDFAGIENEFVCNDELILENFLKGYISSKIDNGLIEVKKDILFPRNLDLHQYRKMLGKDKRYGTDEFNKNFYVDLNECQNVETFNDSRPTEECNDGVKVKTYQACELRKHEGYMINSSLGGLRADIKELVKSSVKGDAEYLPIFIDNGVYPYCRNLNVGINNFSLFYDYRDVETESSGVIFKILKDFFKINTKELIFSLFTVINFNSMQGEATYNNPPSIPYININPLIYFYENNNVPKMTEAYTNIMNKLKEYTYYWDSRNYKIPEFNTLNRISDIKRKVEIVIKYIKTQNPSTLIGSLETTMMLQTLTFDKFSCVALSEEDTEDTPVGFLKKQGYEIDIKKQMKYFKKYLKYKQKYQLLKNKL
jgi:hypothetical protein